jgi:hypothetical protein
MLGLDVAAIFVLVFLVLIVRAYFDAKNIEKLPPPREGELGRTAAYLSPFTDSKHSLPDSQTKKGRTPQDAGE